METFTLKLTERLVELGINTPAEQKLSLSNLLCLLPVIGEKLGWGDDVCTDCGRLASGSDDKRCNDLSHSAVGVSEHIYIAHQILNIFLNKSEQEAYQISEKYLINLLK